jgi:hypothetical protein
MNRGSEGCVDLQGRAGGEEAEDGQRHPHRRRLHLSHGQHRQRPDSDDGLGFGPPYQVSCPCSLFGKFFSPPTQAGETVDATVGLLPRWLAGFEPKTLAVAFNVSYYSWIFINPQHALQSPTETVGCMPNRFPVQRIRPQSTNWQEPCRHKPAAPSCTTKRSRVVERRRSERR